MDADGIDMELITMILGEARDKIKQLKERRNQNATSHVSPTSPHPQKYAPRISPQVVKLVERLAEQAHVTDKLKPLNARSCVVCGGGSEPLKMRSNGFKCKACTGKPSKQKYVVIPEEFSHLEVNETRLPTSGGDDDDDEKTVKVINDFVLEKQLGSGSQAVVHRGYHLSNPNMFFAIKAVRKSNNPAAMLAVNKEFNIMKTLNHPSLIHIIAIINDPNPKAEYIYIVMEMLKRQIYDPPQIEGEKKEPIPLNRLRKYIVGIASGLEYLHKKGIFHRDIKPENVLLDDSDNVRVADFGVSSVGDDGGGHLDQVASGEGTPMYFPPENFDQEPVHGKAQDIWAFGVTIYVMALGYYPFPLIANSIQMGKNIKSLPIEYPDDIDPDLRDLLSRMLVREPSKRISTQGILAHKFVANVHHSKGYPVEPITTTLACVRTAEEASALDDSVDGAFVVPEARRFEPALVTLTDFIKKSESKAFQLVTAQYSATLYATKK